VSPRRRKSWNLGLLPGDALLEFGDAGLGRGPIHGIDDVFGLASKRWPRLLTVLRPLGDVAGLTAEDGKGAGDALRDRGPEDSLLEVGRKNRPTIGHVPRGIVHGYAFTGWNPLFSRVSVKSDSRKTCE
jgi:hypothetical protein